MNPCILQGVKHGAPTNTGRVSCSESSISVAATSLGLFCILKITWHHLPRLLGVERGPIDF
jgi:hypothetical protein